MNIQTTKLVNRAKGARAALYPILNKNCPIPTKTKISIYKIYIKPILLYASAAWGPLVLITKWSRIETVQNIATRTITGVHFLTRNTSLLDSFSLPTIQECAIHTAKITFCRAATFKYPHLQQLGRAIPPAPDDKKMKPISFANSQKKKIITNYNFFYFN